MPYAPGGTTTTQSPAELVNAAWDRAVNVSSQATTDSTALFNKALGQASTAPHMTASVLNWTPNVKEPEVYIPMQAEGASVAMFQKWWGEIVDKLSGEFQFFIDNYFPNDTPYLQQAEAWISKALTTGGTGLAPAIEDQIWQRDRARVLKDMQRLEEEAAIGFAAKRYPMPPGALHAQLHRIKQDASDKIAQASRDVAIKQAEMELENVKYAVEQAIKLYSTAIAAAGDFIKSLSGNTGSIATLIPSVTDSQSKLIGAASEYYRARISVEELKMKAIGTTPEWQQAASAKNADLEAAALRSKVDAAIEAAKAMSTQAAAALNAMHASAGISGSASTSVGYSYSNDTAGSPAPLTAI